MSGNMEKLCKIRDVQRSIIAFEQRFVKRHGICLNEGMLLCSLHQSERLSSGELGELLGLTPSNTSKVIASLEKGRFIRRKACKDDKRCMKFCITKQGKELLQRLNCDSLQLPESLQTLSEQAEQQEQ